MNNQKTKTQEINCPKCKKKMTSDKFDIFWCCTNKKCIFVGLPRYWMNET